MYDNDNLIYQDKNGKIIMRDSIKGTEIVDKEFKEKVEKKDQEIKDELVIKKE